MSVVHMQFYWLSMSYKQEMYFTCIVFKKIESDYLHLRKHFFMLQGEGHLYLIHLQVV